MSNQHPRYFQKIIIDLWTFGQNLLKKTIQGDSRCLSLTDIYQLIETAEQIFQAQPMLLRLSPPLNVCGDIHGQYTDLLRLLQLDQPPPQRNFLFLGDYVDRGSHSIETICLLLAYKCLYPVNFFLLRGNHECQDINKGYGFYEECLKRYPESHGGETLWNRFNSCFSYMPISAIVDGSILCMHGGLSPRLTSIDQIDRIPRPLVEIKDDSLECDILWSDPESGAPGWNPSDRGVSFTFGPDVVEKFVEDNGLQLVCRAQQVVEDGYEFFCQRRLVTVFSAPRYCGEFDNAAGMLQIRDDMFCSFMILK